MCIFMDVPGSQTSQWSPSTSYAFGRVLAIATLAQIPRRVGKLLSGQLPLFSTPFALQRAHPGMYCNGM